MTNLLGSVPKFCSISKRGGRVIAEGGKGGRNGGKGEVEVGRGGRADVTKEEMWKEEGKRRGEIKKERGDGIGRERRVERKKVEDEEGGMREKEKRKE